jgi:hypothetical protein
MKAKAAGIVRYQGYEVRNTVNGKIYNGISFAPGRTWEDRVNDELSLHGIGNKHYYNAIVKYGRDAFSSLLTGEFESFEDLCFDEIVRIVRAKSYMPKYGYNKTLGGDGIFLDDESRIKMSAEQSERMKERNKEPEFKKKAAAAGGRTIRRLNADPEIGPRLRLQHSEFMKSHPEIGRKNMVAANNARKEYPEECREKHLAGIAEYSSRPEVRAGNSERMKARLQNPEFVEKNKAAVRAAHKTEAWRINFHKGIDKYYSSLDVLKSCAERMAALKCNPEIEARRVAAVRKKHADPEWQAKRVAASNAGIQRYWANRRAQKEARNQ